MAFYLVEKIILVVSDYMAGISRKGIIVEGDKDEVLL